MYQNQGYKFVFFMGILIQGLGLLFCFFFMEEVGKKQEKKKVQNPSDSILPLSNLPLNRHLIFVMLLN